MPAIDNSARTLSDHLLRRLLPVFLFGVAGSLAAAPLSAQEEERVLDRFEEECGDYGSGEGYEEGSRLSDQCQPLAEIPNRPRPIIELGEPFLGTGTLGDGFTIPGGAVWQPSFLAFGSLRTALQGGDFRTNGVELVEAATRMDLFGNLYLTQTERVLVGIRPLDQRGRFTSYTLSANDLTPPLRNGNDPTDETFESFENFNVVTLFMEGDLAELFPFLDRDDKRGLDIYFGVGRQPISFQDGMLINENAIDMVGLTRANMKIGSLVNVRVTGVYGWGEIGRHGGGGNPLDETSQLFGMFWEIDRRAATWEVDAIYVTGDPVSGDGIYAGFGDIRRIGKYSNTFRVLASFPTGDETPFNQQGVLIHNQFSWTPKHNYNFWYVNTFVGIDRFRSASRGPAAGGPLGATGILFAAPGIGRLGASLGNEVDNSVGGSIGHQIFMANTRQQLTVEVGGRYRLNDDAINTTAAGGGIRYQFAMGRRFVVAFDGFGIYDNDFEEVNFGGRTELVLKF